MMLQMNHLSLHLIIGFKLRKKMLIKIVLLWLFRTKSIFW